MHFQIGDKVELKEGSKFFHQSVIGGTKSLGTILGDSSSDGWYRIRWENGRENTYPKQDIIRINSHRILNSDDDPFGEENYGFIRENVNYKFKKGNKVKILPEAGYPQLINEIGTIIASESNFYYLVEFDQEYPFCHSGNNLGKPQSCLWITNDEMDLVKPRKLNPKDDPFGEENYGFVQESLTEFDLSQRVAIRIHNRYEFDKLMLELHKMGYRWGDNSPIEKHYKSEYEMIYLNLLSPNGRTIHWSKRDYYEDESGFHEDHSTFGKNYIDSYGGKNYTRILNLEDDPLGEDDWGFVQENVKTLMEKEYSIRIWNREEYNILMGFLEKEGCLWGGLRRATELPYTNDEIIIIRNNNISSIRYEKYIKIGLCEHIPLYDIDFTSSDPFVNLGKGRKRLFKLEDDPFGEEDYGYVKENVKNYKDFLLEYEGGPPMKDIINTGKMSFKEIDPDRVRKKKREEDIEDEDGEDMEVSKILKTPTEL